MARGKKGNFGWIGVDLDGTLAYWKSGTNINTHGIGEPIPLMVERVKEWLSQGLDVRIMTARVSGVGRKNDGPAFVKIQRRLVEEWCEKHLGQILPVTNEKDYMMEVLWDDRAIPVERNTGRLLLEGGEGDVS